MTLPEQRPPTEASIERAAAIAENDNFAYRSSYTYGQDPFDEERRLDPLKFVALVVRYRWVIATLSLTGLAVGTVYTWLQTPIYRATTKIEILISGARVIQDFEIVSQGNDFWKFQTAKEKILSRNLARRVVFELNLSEEKDFLAPPAT